MINKNNIYILIKNAKNLIASDEFRVKHSLKQNAFTRNRKLSFQDIIYFILGFPRKSLSTELDFFVKNMNTLFLNKLFLKQDTRYHHRLLKIFSECQLIFFSLPNNQKL